MAKQYWLMKSEPDEFSLEDLKNSPKQTAHWDGVRNYQARNFMRDQMKLGDEVFFYHSNAKPKAIVGICKVVRESYPDHTSWDPKDKHYDEKSSPENPRWFMVDVKFVKAFNEPVTLDALKANTKLKEMALVQRGTRLSVHPVTKQQWDEVLRMAE